MLGELTLIVRPDLLLREKAFFHVLINDSYDPLLEVLPLSLADKTYDDDAVVRESSELLPLSGEAPARTSGISAEAREAGDDKAGDNEIGEVYKAEDNGMGEAGGADHGDGAEAKADTEERLYGFAHPAISRPQRTVWIPQDALGLAGEEEKACREAGVRVSTHNAAMDEKGKVSISGIPPDVKEED